MPAMTRLADDRGGSRRAALALAGGTAMAVALTTSGLAQSAPVEITMWSWVPNLQEQIDLFEERNPDIDVNLVNAGQGAAQYMELRNAIRAGRGAPDVVQIALDTQPTFQITGALLDIGLLGANEVADDFVEWAWAQVSAGGAVYGIPWDSGPMGIIYRGDIFDEVGIAEPATWDEFRAAAETLRAERPDAYITTAAFSAGAWTIALFWQAGARPFEMIDETTIRITMNSPEARQVADYWTGLIADDLVDTSAIFNTDWYSSLDRGRIASWITAAWGPSLLSQFTSDSMGSWRAMPLPQWDAAAPAASNWGGSTIAVMGSTEHPEAAARLALFLGADTDAAQMFIERQGLFPVLKERLASDSFLDATMEFYGGVSYNQVFASASELIDTSFEWSPFNDHVYQVLSSELSAAAANGGDLSEALDRVQEELVTYARAQGFTVVE
ncbi:ABC transporter substrate-binding protein [Histidinibacterium lentulum]|nr:sugar ABC transporter substrate-binding protein [Histidinibacterium lentulum]